MENSWRLALTLNVRLAERLCGFLEDGVTQLARPPSVNRSEWGLKKEWKK